MTNPTRCEAPWSPHRATWNSTYSSRSSGMSCRPAGLRDAAGSFATHVVDGLQQNREHIAGNLPRSLVLVTAPNPRIGYDKALKIGKLAFAENVTLKRAAEQLGYVRPKDFDRWVVPAAMTVPGATLPGGGG
jgi:fumarate hydratase, class II